MREKPLLQRVERHSCPIETSSSKQSTLSENVLNVALRKKSLGNKAERSSVQGVDISILTTCKYIFSEEEGQDREINHAQHEHDKKNEEVVLRQLFATG